MGTWLSCPVQPLHVSDGIVTVKCWVTVIFAFFTSVSQVHTLKSDCYTQMLPLSRAEVRGAPCRYFPEPSVTWDLMAATVSPLRSAVQALLQAHPSCWVLFLQRASGRVHKQTAQFPSGIFCSVGNLRLARLFTCFFLVKFEWDSFCYS